MRSETEKESEVIKMSALFCFGLGAFGLGFSLCNLLYVLLFMRKVKRIWGRV